MRAQIGGDVAQSVEQRTENPCVVGSIPIVPTPKKPLQPAVAFLFSNFKTKSGRISFEPIMRKSTISIDVLLDTQNIPEEISWHASDNPGQVEQTKSFALSFWDAENSAIMRIDLWTKDMLVGEMKRFFLQSLGGMNETLKSATNDQEWFDEVEKTIQKLALKLREEEAQDQN